MIPAQLYSTVYYFIVTILTIGLSLNYANYDNSRLRSDIKRPTVGAFIVMLTFALFIGFRPISGVFVDMMNYHMFYNFRCGQPFVFVLVLVLLLFVLLFVLVLLLVLSFSFFPK